MLSSKFVNIQNVASCKRF